MDLVDAIRLASMGAVVRGDGEYNLRSILRWYSKTFYTPLPEVEGLPIEHVLRNYFETVYEEMPEEKRMQEIQSLLETEDERRARRQAEDAADAEAEEFAKFTEQQTRGKAAKQAGEGVRRAAETLDSNEIRKVEDQPPKILPDLRMTFLETDQEFESMLEGSFGPPDKERG